MLKQCSLLLELNFNFPNASCHAPASPHQAPTASFPFFSVSFLKKSPLDIRVLQISGKIKGGQRRSGAPRPLPGPMETIGSLLPFSKQDACSTKPGAALPQVALGCITCPWAPLLLACRCCFSFAGPGTTKVWQRPGRWVHMCSPKPSLSAQKEIWAQPPCGRRFPPSQPGAPQVLLPARDSHPPFPWGQEPLHRSSALPTKGPLWLHHTFCSSNALQAYPSLFQKQAPTLHFCNATDRTPTQMGAQLGPVMATVTPGHLKVFSFIACLFVYASITF